MNVITAPIHCRQATLEDIPKIVKMHRSYIAEEDLEKFQDLYLDYYYQELIRSDNFVFVAVDGNSVIGFCSLVADHGNVLVELIKHKFTDLFKIPLSNWFQVLPYVFRRLYCEVFGGKWSNNEVEEFRSCGELRAIAVDPEYREFHVGTNLLKTCIEMARRTYKMPMIAWVLEKNEPSLRLFLGDGFRKAGVRKDRSGDFFLLVLDS